MKLILIVNDRLRFFYLPKVVKNNYWITYLDDNGLEQNLINIEAIDGKWQIINNNDTYCVSNNNVSNVLLREYQVYFLKTYFQQDYLILFCLPDLEMQIGTYDISTITDKEITIGKQFGDTINYQIKLLDDVNSIIYTKNGKYFIKDNHSRYGTFVNKVKITDEKELHYGDVIFILGLKIIFIKNNNKNILMMNNVPLNVKVNLPTAILEKNPFNANMIDDKDSDYLYIKPQFYHKNPRFISGIKPLQLKIDPPPTSEKPQNGSIILTIASMLTMSMTSLVSGIYSFNNLINNKQDLKSAMPSLLICFSMFLSTMLLPLISRSVEKKNKKKREKLRQEKYRKYISDTLNLINKEAAAQSHALKNLYPSSEECQNIILSKQVNLWCKRVEDDDFFCVSLGYGNIPMEINTSFPEKHFSLEDDNLLDYVSELGKEKKLLVGVPIKFSFIENFISCITEDKKNYYNYLKNIIIQLIAFHSYDELKIVILTDKKNELYWSDLAALPHLWDDNKKFRFYATSVEEYNEINYILNEELNNNINLKNKNTNKAFDKNYLIITDSFYSVRNMEIIKKMLDYPDYAGFSLLILDDSITAMPPECKAFIKLGSVNEVFNRDYSNSAIEFASDNSSKIDLNVCSRSLSNIFVEIQNKTFSNLPIQVGLLELYNVSKVEQLNSAARWNKNNLIFNMQVPVGIDENEEITYLDLHEKYHGPHGLVAGMTGSGKSEFLITYILSLAINFSPEEVQFAIIDYKGGGLSGAFQSSDNRSLPHLVGTVTNLDDNDIQRILLSINSELKRRQTAFNIARDKSNNSTIDIYKYQQLYKEKVVDTPVSHLFLIVDEFAEMKNQQPEFMEQLISIARIGRSLGVHLILSTQKPSGVVDNQIWSNSRFRICFRVQDASDSMEVIKKPDAAALKNIGRFYLQVGYNEVFKLVQSAYSGGIYTPSDNLIKKADTAVDFINSVGTIIKKIDIPKISHNESAKIVEAKAILDYLVKTGVEEEKYSQPLWLDKLPSVIYLSSLEKKYGFSNNLSMIIGELDSPATQARKLFSIDLTTGNNVVIYGGGTEAEKLLMTGIYSLATRFTADDINFYVLDFGGESLNAFSKAPTVGDIIFADNSEKVTNLFNSLLKEIDVRKQLMANVVGNYSNYYKQTGKKIPLIVVIVNNYSSFKEAYADYVDSLIKLTRDGGRYGIIFIVTVNSQLGLGYKLEQNFKTKIALRLNDKNSYYSIVGRTTILPSNLPGRGIINLGGVYEFQTASITEESKVIEHVLNICQNMALSASKFAPKVKVLPKEVTVANVESNINGLEDVPLGYVKDSLALKTYNFKKNYCNIVLADNYDYLVPFTKALITILTKIANNKTIVFDPMKYLGEGNYLYYNMNIGENLKKLTEQFEQTIDWQESITCVLFGANNVLHSLKQISDISKLINSGKKNGNVTFIFVDKQSELKKMEYDEWYKSNVDSYSGIWIGENISNQFTLKTSKSIRESQYGINEDFAFVVEKGKFDYVKVVKEK